MVDARRAALAAAVVLAAACGLFATGQTGPVPSTFAGRIAALSGPGGYFDTDNLISNERSFQHVVPAIAAGPAPGGAYLGVGPDQNFTYIAHARPSIALIVDIRRDNLLLHLLFKALFATSDTRAAYLAGLTGRVAVPASRASEDLEAIVGAIDGQPRLDDDAREALGARLRTVIDGFGVPLSQADHATIRHFHQRFIDQGLSLRFNTEGRPPQWDYPSYRDLLLETDRSGTRRSFMSSDELFDVVRVMQAEDRIIPVVGDLGEATALPAIARFLEAERIGVSVFYASNVEFYLFRQRTFETFIENVRLLPLAPRATLVRSAFQGARTEPGYNSASLTQRIGDLLDAYDAGRIRLYWDLLSASR